MWLAWELALLMAAVLVVVGVAVGRSASTKAGLWSSFSYEAAVVLVLYAVWIVAGRLSVYDLDGAYSRAQGWWDFERAIWLPNEATLQRWSLPHSWFVQANNIYYAIAHVPSMIAALVWMWFRHRGEYSSFRNVVAAVTGACLLMQLLPVAPPRFVDGLGIIDTPALYGQSVYSALGYQTAGQLQAMPSIHMAWALQIGWFGWRFGKNWWRLVGPIHAVATALVVVITGNHYWVDGIVAGLFLLVALPAEKRIRLWLFRRFRPEPEVAQVVPR